MLVTKAQLRRFIADQFRSDSDLDGFCIDYYPGVHARFTGSMDRTAKVNTLLVHAEPTQLWGTLCRWNEQAGTDVNGAYGRTENGSSIADILAALAEYGFLKKDFHSNTYLWQSGCKVTACSLS